MGNLQKKLGIALLFTAILLILPLLPTAAFAAVTPVSPSGTITTSTPTYSWGAVRGAKQYQITLSISGGSSSSRWVTAGNASCSSGSGSCSSLSPQALAAGTYSWTLQSWDGKTTTPSAVTLTFTIPAPPQPAAIPKSTPGTPSGTITVTTPTYSWSAVRGAKQYKITLTDSNGSSSRWVTADNGGCASGSGNCSSLSPQALAYGNYSWGLESWDGKTTRTEFTGRSFSIPTPQQPPSIPKSTPITPLGTITVSTPTYSWSAVPGAKQYKITLTDSNGSSSRWVTADNGGCGAGSGNCSSLSPQALAYGNYSWSLESWDGTTTRVEFTAQSFSIPAPQQPPSVPKSTPITPLGTITVSTPTYSWSAVPGAKQYKITLTDSNGSSSRWVTADNGGCSSGSGNCSSLSPQALAYGNYSWGLESWDGTTTRVEFTAQNFSIPTPPQPPSVPKSTPIAPIGTITVSTPTYSWSAVPGAKQYKITLTDSNGSSSRWVTADNGGCSSGSGNCSSLSPQTLAYGNYSWSLESWNGTTTRVEFTAQNFSIPTPPQPPSVPKSTPIAPMGAITVSTPTYSWSAVPGAKQYKITLTDSLGTSSSRWVTADNGGCSSGSGNCSSLSPQALADGSYTWGLESWDGTTTRAEFTNTTFSISTPKPPSIPKSTPIAPMGGITVSTPTYSWSAVPGAKQYKLTLTDSNGISSSRWVTADNGGCSSGSGNCSSISPQTLADGAYTWGLESWDGTTTRVEFTNTAFSISTPKPPSIPKSTPITPMGEVTMSTPTYSWSAVPGAKQYKLTLTDSSGISSSRWVTADNGSCGSGSGNCSSLSPQTLADGAYTWGLESWDGTSTRTEFTDIKFSITTPKPPSVPKSTPIAPMGTITVSTPTYSWSAVRGAKQYKLSLTDSNGISSSRWVTAANASCSSGTGNCSSLSPQTLADGAYTWGLESWDGTSTKTEFTSVSFTVSTRPATSAIRLSADTVAENSITPLKVGTLSHVAPGVDTTVFTISGGVNASSFEIRNNNELWIASGTTLDYETRSSLIVAIRDGSKEQSFSIKITDVNEAPTAVTVANTTVAENSALTKALSLGSLTATDPDVNSQFLGHTFAITGGADQALFRINGTSLEIVAGAVLDYEARTDPNTHVQITATDAGGLKFAQDLTIAVTDVNEAPTALAISKSSVDENSAATSAATVGALTATDPDAGDSVTFTITGGADKALFNLNGTDLQIGAGTALNYETIPTHSLSVEITATDRGGLTFVKALTITINDINEIPTDITLSSNSIYENIDPITPLTVGTLAATDPDTADTHTFTVASGVNQALFAISGDRLQILPGTTLSAATTPTLKVDIKATDSGTPALTFTKSFTITVNQANIMVTTTRIDENTQTTNDVSLGKIIAVGNQVFTIVGGADQSVFKNSGTDLFIKAGTVLNYEVKSSYAVKIETTNVQGPYSATVIITVNDLNEAPTAITLNNRFLPFIDRPANASVGTLTTTDEDANETFTYTLPDNLNGRFAISGDQLIVVDTPNPLHGVFNVGVRVTDKGGLTFDQTFAITIVGFTVDTIPSTPTVASMLSASLATYATIYKNLVKTPPGGSLDISEEEFENLVVGKAAQQLTTGGQFTHTITDIIQKFNIKITPNLITSTIQLGMVGALRARLSGTSQAMVDSLFQTIAPYAMDYRASLQLNVVPVLSGGEISFDKNLSTVNIVHEPSYIPTIGLNLSDMISTYNGLLEPLATQDKLGFFLGGGANPPLHFLLGAIGDQDKAKERFEINKILNLSGNISHGSVALPGQSRGSQAIPLSEHLDYYFPGLISEISINQGRITLKRYPATFNQGSVAD